MYKPSIDDMLKGKQSRYSLVIGVAKRAREITEECIQNEDTTIQKPVMCAIEDFKEHKYEILEPEVNN